MPSRKQAGHSTTLHCLTSCSVSPWLTPTGWVPRLTSRRRRRMRSWADLRRPAFCTKSQEDRGAAFSVTTDDPFHGPVCAAQLLGNLAIRQTFTSQAPGVLSLLHCQMFGHLATSSVRSMSVTHQPRHCGDPLSPPTDVPTRKAPWPVTVVVQANIRTGPRGHLNEISEGTNGHGIRLPRGRHPWTVRPWDIDIPTGRDVLVDRQGTRPYDGHRWQHRLGPPPPQCQLVGRGSLAFRDITSSSLWVPGWPIASTNSVAETTGYVTRQSGRQHAGDLRWVAWDHNRALSLMGV